MANNNKWGISWKPRLDRNSAIPLYLQIAGAMSDDIRSGILKPGNRLPPVRPLSYFLGCNTGTVHKAYLEARRRGYISGEIGRGSFVKASPADPGSAEWPNENPTSRIIDMSDNFPPPQEQIDRILRDEIRTLADLSFLPQLLQYQYNSQAPPHVHSAETFLRTLGCPTGEDRKTLITCGALHAGFISLLAATSPGDLVITEEFTSQAVTGALRKLNLRHKGVPMDRGGIVPEKLREMLQYNKVTAAFFVPDLHNPTTSTLYISRRVEIAEILADAGVYLIEDGVLAPLIAKSRPPLSSLMPELSFFIASLSKIAAPSLRTGYLNMPAALYEKALSAQRITSWMSSPLTSQIAASLTGKGLLKEIISLRRHELEKRQKLACDILQGLDVQTHPQSPHLWLHLPEPLRAGIFAAELRKKEVSVIPSDHFSVDRGNTVHAVRICLGTPATANLLKEGLEIIRSEIGSSST